MQKRTAICVIERAVLKVYDRKYTRAISMTKLHKSAALCSAILALSGCGKKPSYHAAAQQSEQHAAPVPSAPSQQADASPVAAQNCSPPVPDKMAVQNGLQKAMVAIYGIDEAPVKFQVLQITQADCEHATVRYRGTGSAAQTAPIAIGDGGKWFLTLYSKPYPVE